MSLTNTELAEHVSRGYVVPVGRLPVTELAFDRPGAAAPFGDDLPIPLPVDMLTYVHPGFEKGAKASTRH